MSKVGTKNVLNSYGFATLHGTGVILRIRNLSGTVLMNFSQEPLSCSWRGSMCITTRPPAANMSPGYVTLIFLIQFDLKVFCSEDWIGKFGFLGWF
jgi:hypothetical protein